MSNVRQTSREVFDFFRLPRELLNASYDLDDMAGYCDLPSPVEQYEAISLRTRVPLTNLLLVNRQLNNEYTDRCKSLKQSLSEKPHWIDTKESPLTSKLATPFIWSFTS